MQSDTDLAKAADFEAENEVLRALVAGHRDEILKRDLENEALMEINNRLVAVKRKEDFVTIIDTDLRKYIPYDENNLLLYVQENKAYRMYSYHVLPERLQDPVFHAMAGRDYPDMNTRRTSHLPEVIQVQDLVEEQVPWAIAVHRMGVREIMHLKLLDGNEIVGQLVLLSQTYDG